MAMIGDGNWKSFNIVEDIQNIVGRMERKVANSICEEEKYNRIFRLTFA